MEALFDIDMQFRWDMSPITSREYGEGRYIGSGEGTANGQRICGSVRWDLFEIEEKRFCRSNLIGTIDTIDGANISFNSRGFFIKPDEAKPKNWVTTSSVLFETIDGRYNWLNNRIGVWEGTFDMETYRHVYQAYLQPPR